MTLLFGAVASMYDDVRPGYPPAILAAITDYHGGVPADVAELGAGTGKGTELLVRLGAPVTAIEPDERMAAVLRAKFPEVEVVNLPFEQWEPPSGGVDLIGCGLAWHWLDPVTRNQRAYEALASGGTLAVFAHQYRFADPVAADRIYEAMRSTAETPTVRPDHWILDDITAAGIFTDVVEREFHTPAEFSTDRYLRLTQTFSPFRRRPPAQQQRYLSALGEAVEELGGSILLDLHTTIVLGSRP